jgi:hypothetical protein
VELIKNTQTGEFGIEGEVFIGIFDKYITLAVEDDNLIYSKKCAAYLNELPESLLKELCEASIRYCNDFLEAIGEAVMVFEKAEDVLKHIYPSVLMVPFPDGITDPVIHMELNCSWEEEHGMEWVIRGNKVLYVGAFNGENPLGNFSPKQRWNFA